MEEKLSETLIVEKKMYYLNGNEVNLKNICGMLGVKNTIKLDDEYSDFISLSSNLNSILSQFAILLGQLLIYFMKFKYD